MEENEGMRLCIKLLDTEGSDSTNFLETVSTAGFKRNEHEFTRNLLQKNEIEPCVLGDFCGNK